ncbi:hypothetical protein [Janthinobacterium sp. GW458P]|uniref:hypothetical protein n=1 Tax=Janthinobacterium sp. GW458P TaxID=1981504 RepID=UPI00111F5153|nr:hypothetical protein [Janthinobacterium sp. GW458P]MBE3027385.1 hypothetical protein [Janthinobacterium sp. GW458P]
MASFKKTVVILFVSATLAFVPIRSQAIVPLIAGWLLEITYGSILISDIVAGVTGTISAIFWYECNKFGSINTSVCNNKPPSMPAAQAPKPAITVSLKPDAKRENPDPKKFSDPAPGSGKRDVTPKPQIAASGNPPPPPPAGPISIGVFAQNPSEPHNDPSAESTRIWMAKQSHAYGDGYVAGVITVKQMFAPDRAFPFVAKVVTCRFRPDINPSSEEGLAEGADCLAKADASNAALEARYLTSARDSYWIRIPSEGLRPGDLNVSTDVRGKAVVFYDQARDVDVSCDPGYSASASDSSKCDLTNVSAVKKPADTTCEILFDPATKQMLTDKANPACDGLSDTAKLTLASQDGSQSIEVGANAGNGFDISITKSDGSKTGLDTGVYDPGTGGYVIVHVNITPPEKPDKGLGCGGPGQSACSVEFARDDATSVKSSDTNAANRTADTGMKGKLDAISSSQFNWSFIPSIPTAVCKNPSLKSPIGNVTINMDICVWFDRLSFFINAVLGVLCVYGCVNQIQSAIRD